jgi:hypothetical protein
VPDETLQQVIRAWLGVVIQAGVAIVAIWQDRIRAWLKRPKLAVFANTAPPDCDLTHFNAEYGHQIVMIARCYYFRLRIQNNGERLAEKVEVYVERVEKRQVDNTFCIVGNFPPMNLRWAHVGGATRDLGPGMEKFCDFGYIVDPKALREHPEYFALEVKRRDLEDQNAVVFTTDLEVKPNHGGHVIGPGTYRFFLAVGAANVKPTRRCLEMFFSGSWFDESRMYSDGIRFRFTDESGS